MRLTYLNKQLWGFIFLLCFSILNFAQKKDDFIIVIDAGHGGEDSGTHGHYQNEKYIALDVALLFGKLIEKKHKDVTVVYTRTSDVFITLNGRAKIANRANADLFVSIHCNSASRKEAIGTETFVMGLRRMKENIEVSKRENSVIFLEENYKENYQSFDPNDPEAVIMFNMMHTAYQDQSIQFADLVERNFVKNNRFSRGVKQNIFHVLRETAMPSVLIEIGFISNAEDAEFLNSSKGKKETAQSIYDAFKQYKKAYDRKNGVVNDVPIIVKKVKEIEKPVDGISYKIQFLTSQYNYSKSSPKLNGLVGVDVRRAGTVYKYYYGDTSLVSERDELLAYVKRKGFKDAFYVEIADEKATQTVYKIQILTSNKKYRARARQLKPLKNVERVKEGKLYKYYYGKTQTNIQAEKLLKEVKSKGFNNAFIVEF